MLFYSITFFSSYAQGELVQKYYGSYTIELYSDSTYHIDQRFYWNVGKYRLSEDTIFFNATPIYDTILMITPDCTRFELTLSEDRVSSYLGEIKTYRAIFGFDRENGTFNVNIPPTESTLPNEIINGQSLKKFPAYLIRKRDKLGVWNAKGQFEEVVRNSPRKFHYRRPIADMIFMLKFRLMR